MFPFEVECVYRMGAASFSPTPFTLHISFRVGSLAAIGIVIVTCFSHKLHSLTILNQNMVHNMKMNWRAFISMIGGHLPRNLEY